MNQFSNNTAPIWTPRLIHELSDAPDLPSAAALMAARRVPVFPCVPGGKRPLVERGFHEASISPGTVAGWWHRWPAANIGVPTGFASGIDVVDVDVHQAGSGYGAFAEARANGLMGQWAWLVRTPSGGLHAYYMRTIGEEQRSWQAPNRHIDFRGDGGYIVAPPSRAESGSYRVIAVSSSEPESVDGPALRDFLDPPRPTPRLHQSGAAIDSDRLAAWVAGQPEGARNRSLFWAACRMVESGHTFNDTTSSLGPAAQQSGLDEREVITTIRSAYRTTSSSTAHRAARPRTPPRQLERAAQTTTTEGIGR